MSKENIKEATEHYDKIGKEYIEFDPASIETQHNDLDNTYDENDFINYEWVEYYDEPEYDWWAENKVFECNDNYDKYFKSFIDKYFTNCLDIVLPYKKHKKVYLAGKISPNGWRQSIFDMRNNFSDYEYSNITAMIDTEFKYNKNISITGPWFLSCDHSCYHGERNHGVGIHSNCSGNECGPFTGKEVTDICRYQISKSDIIFAYINDDTCYGTLAEIGYAKAKGKKIVTIFDCEGRKKNMWFISKLSDYSTTIESEWENDPGL